MINDFIRFLNTLPVWYLLLCIYLILVYISFVYLIHSKYTDKSSYFYLFVKSIFFPITLICTFVLDFIDFLIDLIYNVVCFTGYAILGLLTIPILLLTHKDDNEEETEEDNKTMTEQKVMTKDNVLLYEKHDVTTTEALNTDDGKTMLVRGVKIFRVIKPLENGEAEVIAQYLAETDSIDLSVLHDYIGYYMASVDRDSYNNDKFVWNCVELGEGSEDSTVFTIMNSRACTEDEVKLLNELFPEYYDHAF